jgi:putative restriction endonuclease
VRDALVHEAAADVVGRPSDDGATRTVIHQPRRLANVRYWVANTDLDWFSFLASQPPLDEVNFWQPNKVRPVTLPAGALWLFKLHVRNGGWVVGGAYFAHYTTVTPRLAWSAFERANGTPTLEALVQRIARYSQRPIDADSTVIGSSVLVQPFFLPRDLWVAPPEDWSTNLTRGKSYDTDTIEGRALWERVMLASSGLRAAAISAISESPSAPYGSPTLVRPRLGQGAFRVMVTDAYDRRCVVTGERTLPVLEAAHIKPYSLVGQHEISNGLLLRSDLHTLFDLGYLTVTPGDLRVRVSRRIHEEFANGREYYALDGREVRLPQSLYPSPSREMLAWHAQAVFRG